MLIHAHARMCMRTHMHICMRSMCVRGCMHMSCSGRVWMLNKPIAGALHTPPALLTSGTSSVTLIIAYAAYGTAHTPSTHKYTVAATPSLPPTEASGERARVTMRVRVTVSSSTLWQPPPPFHRRDGRHTGKPQRQKVAASRAAGNPSVNGIQCEWHPV